MGRQRDSGLRDSSSAPSELLPESRMKRRGVEVYMSTSLNVVPSQITSNCEPDNATSARSHKLRPRTHLSVICRPMQTNNVCQAAHCTLLVLPHSGGIPRNSVYRLNCAVFVESELCQLPRCVRMLDCVCADRRQTSSTTEEKGKRNEVRRLLDNGCF